jgi:outer membrane immunogenic protein
MPVKAPAVVPPFSWNGCYAGANAGGVSGHVHEDITVPGLAVIDTSGTRSGFIGGGQIGCNWQYDPHWVFGVEPWFAQSTPWRLLLASGGAPLPKTWGASDRLR